MSEIATASSLQRRVSMPPLVRALRPRQWPKNLLVLAAPLAAGRLFEAQTLGLSLLIMAAFMMASWAVYLVNDTVDREVDSRNPRTADRPLARGDVTPLVAISAAAAAAVGALLLGLVVGSVDALLLLVAYMLINVAYSLGLKQVPLLELMIVASGYVLRAAVGGVATEIPLSSWFLAVASFGALWIVTAKRVSEQDHEGHRSVITRYPDGLLDQVRSMALTATALTYALWAFETGAVAGGSWLHEASVAPFLLALLQYELVARRDGGASPEVVITTDRPLQITVAVWLVVIGLATNG